MANRNVKKHLMEDNETFQAVCTKGDFFGNFRETRRDARQDAAGHNAKPGCENHVVSIIQTTTVVRPFNAK